jgi:hypothetical protein
MPTAAMAAPGASVAAGVLLSSSPPVGDPTMELQPSMSPDLSALESHRAPPAPVEMTPDLNVMEMGTLTPGTLPDDGAAQLAPLQDADFAMGDDELGLLLMEDEPTPAKKK